MTARTVLALMILLPTAGCVDPVLDPELEKGKKGGITGAFYCESLTLMANGEIQNSGPCDTQEPLILTEDGTVYWAGIPYGTYQVKASRITFIGESTTGPPSWGAARLSEDAITFTDSDRLTVWRLG